MHNKDCVIGTGLNPVDRNKIDVETGLRRFCMSTVLRLASTVASVSDRCSHNSSKKGHGRFAE